MLRLVSIMLVILLYIKLMLFILLYIKHNKHHKKRDVTYNGCFPYGYKAEEIINDTDWKGGDKS